MDRFVARFSAWHGPGAYAAVFALLAASGFGIPINEDVVILGSSALTFYGVFRVPLLIPTILLGLWAGDTLIFFWGRRFGGALVARRPFRWLLPPEKYEAARLRMRNGGAGLIFTTRFLPGVRAPIHFTAGSLGVRWRVFWLCDMGAALLEVPALVFAVRWVGGNVDLILPQFKRAQYALLAACSVYAGWRWRRTRL